MGIKINVKKFIKETIDQCGHPMYGHEYDEIIKKYMDKDNYSFIIAKEKENDFMQCYDSKSTYVHNEQFYGHQTTNYLCINIIIVPHIKWFNENEKSYPLIIRLREENDANTFGGFPIKIWITKNVNCRIFLIIYFLIPANLNFVHVHQNQEV